MIDELKVRDWLEYDPHLLDSGNPLSRFYYQNQLYRWDLSKRLWIQREDNIFLDCGELPKDCRVVSRAWDKRPNVIGKIIEWSCKQYNKGLSKNRVFEYSSYYWIS